MVFAQYLEIEFRDLRLVLSRWATYRSVQMEGCALPQTDLTTHFTLCRYSLDVSQCLLEPAEVPAPNQNDSKLLWTCEVTVERLRTEKFPVKEDEEETESKLEVTLEDASPVATETHSPTVEPVTTSNTSCEIASGSDAMSSKCAGAPQNLCASPTPEADLNPNGFDDIDFDSNSALDYLCHKNYTDWPQDLEFLELTEHGALTSENPVLSDEEKVTATHSSVTTSPTPDQQLAATEPLTNDISAAYTEMRTSLMNPLNILNADWPACFNRQWGTHVEG